MPPPYKNQNNSAGGEQEDEESNQLPITDFPPGGFNAFVPFPAPALNFDPFQNLRAFAHNFPLSVGNNLAFTGEFASSAFTPNQSRFNPPAAELGTSAMQHRPLSPPTGPSANDMSSPAQHSKAAMKLQLDSRAAELREQLLKRRKEGTPDSGVFVPHPVPKLTAAQPNVPANDNDIAALIADISAAAPEPMASASPDQASDGKKQGPQAQPNGEPALQKHQQQNAHNNGEAVNQKKNGASHASHANGRTIDTTKLRDAARKASQWYGQSADRGSNSSNSNSFNGSSTLAKIGSSADAALPPKPPTSSRQTALMSRNIATASPSGVSEDGEITENSPRWAEETNPLPHENRRALVGRKNTNPGANNTTAPTPQTNETASVNSFRKPQQDDRPTLSDVQKEPQADNAVELAADDADRRIDPSDKELQEWLIVTDYWNLKHRQGVLARRRRIALLEAEREQLLGEEAAAFTSRGNTTTAPPRPAPVRAMIANTGAPPAPVRATTANAGAPPAPIQQKSIEAPVAMAPEAANPPKETQPTRPPKREYEDTDNDVLHSEKHRRIDERQDGPRPRTAASASHRVHQRDPSPYRIRGPPSPDWPSSRHNSPTRYDNPHYRRDWSPDRGRYEPDSGGPRPPHYFDSDGYVARRYDDHRDHGMDDGRGGQGHGPLGPGRGQPPYVIRKAKQVDLGKKGDTRFFIIKSFNEENVEQCMEDGLWASQEKNREVLTTAFAQCQNVILFFSVNLSRAFQGYARMSTAPSPDTPQPRWMKKLHWDSTQPFRIEWLSTVTTPFDVVHHIHNPLNEDQRVVVAKDGQEVEEEAGREMIKKLEKHAEHMFELELRRDRDRDRDHGGKDFGGDGYHGFPRGGGTRGRGYRGSYRSRGRGRGYVKTEDRD